MHGGERVVSFERDGWNVELIINLGEFNKFISKLREKIEKNEKYSHLPSVDVSLERAEKALKMYEKWLEFFSNASDEEVVKELDDVINYFVGNPCGRVYWIEDCLFKYSPYAYYKAYYYTVVAEKIERNRKQKLIKIVVEPQIR